MDWLRKEITSRERGAALLIVLAFVVLLTGVSVAYLSRTTSDRQVAHGSFNQSKSDQLVASAMDNIIGDLRKEIADGSTATTMASGAETRLVCRISFGGAFARIRYLRLASRAALQR